MGINRTQFNRYLTGESFPRPDVLHQICLFFDVDARILLEPLDELTAPPGVLNHPFLRNHIGGRMQAIQEETFPSGFYRFSRQSFMEDDLMVVGLIYFFRRDSYVFVRGYESRSGMKQQALPTEGALREFRGVVSQHEDGIAFTVSHLNNMAHSFNFLSRVAAFQNGYWVGYSARPARESVTGRRVTRMVYEHLGNDLKVVLPAARSCGYAKPDDLPAFHLKHLRIGRDFV